MDAIGGDGTKGWRPDDVASSPPQPLADTHPPPLSGWVAGWVEGRPLSGFQTPLKEDAPPSPMRNGVVLPWRTYPHRRRCPHR